MLDLEEEYEVTGEKVGVMKRRNFKMYEMVYDWADKKNFASLVEETGIEEGILVRNMMTVNKIREGLGTMATVVGDNALASRLTDMAPLIMRGLVKMQSLYLEVEQEPQKLNTEEEGTDALIGRESQIEEKKEW